MILMDPHDRHFRWSFVARDWRVEVDMTIPGILTSFVNVSAYNKETMKVCVNNLQYS